MKYGGVSVFQRDVKYYVQWRINPDQRSLSDLMRCLSWDRDQFICRQRGNLQEKKKTTTQKPISQQSRQFTSAKETLLYSSLVPRPLPEYTIYISSYTVEQQSDLKMDLCAKCSGVLRKETTFGVHWIYRTTCKLADSTQSARKGCMMTSLFSAMKLMSSYTLVRGCNINIAWTHFRRLYVT